jgi:hypothetical protein
MWDRLADAGAAGFNKLSTQRYIAEYGRADEKLAPKQEAAIRSLLTARGIENPGTEARST